MDVLANAGYLTHSIGKLHVSPTGTAKGMSPDTQDRRFTKENRDLWNKGVYKTFDVPYHGFQTVDFVGGHVNYTFGDYAMWLEKQKPGGHALLSREKALKTPPGPNDAWTIALPGEFHYNTYIADHTAQFLRQRGKDKKPFFLWASFPDPHHPYAAPEPYASLVNPKDVFLPAWDPSEEDLMPPHYKRALHDPQFKSNGIFGATLWPDEWYRAAIAYTCGMVKMIDDSVGKILKALRENGLSDNTIVLFTSDHADLMSDHRLVKKGPFLYRGLIRVPMLFSGPGVTNSGVLPAIASLLDLVPTVLDFTGLSFSEGYKPLQPEEPETPALPGVSLRPVLNGKADSVRDSALVEFDDGYLGIRQRCLVTERYRIVVYQGAEYGELFDLQEDPGEHVNLWNDPDYDSIRSELTAALLDEVMRTDWNLPRRTCHA
jgi:arylsulfatase A-like enzyme